MAIWDLVKFKSLGSGAQAHHSQRLPPPGRRNQSQRLQLPGPRQKILGRSSRNTPRRKSGRPLQRPLLLRQRLILGPKAALKASLSPPIRRKNCLSFMF